MPSEHEPIEARVVDGVAQADTSAPPASSAPPPPRAMGNLGCLVFPAAMGITSLVLGLWLMSGWNTLSPLGALGAVFLTLFGVAVISLIITAFLLMLRLRRLMRNLTQDVRKVAEAMQQVATMKVEPKPPENADAPADPDDALAPDAAALPPPSFPDASETPGNKPPT